MPYQPKTLERVAADCRSRGLAVTFQPGWNTRGSSTFSPRGLIWHHTASGAGSLGLNVVVNGRAGLPGPLCHIFLPRDNHRGVYGDIRIVAAGRANHGGVGSWRGVSGNSNWWGIEADNNGVGERWSDRMLRAYHEVSAALARRTPFDPGLMICAHHEYAPSRKIDPFGPPHGGKWPMGPRRSAVKALLSGGSTPAPPPPPKEEDVLRRGDKGGAVWRCQRMINEYNHGAPESSKGIPVDGGFGPKTESAVNALRKGWNHQPVGNGEWDTETSNRVQDHLTNRKIAALRADLIAEIRRIPTGSGGGLSLEQVVTLLEGARIEGSIKLGS
ncbi:MAG: hypothetical protein GEU78_15065 [Actinobacteria bacterium]|nr:hypothetical protein [Actinomycetota bacterium]